MHGLALRGEKSLDQIGRSNGRQGQGELTKADDVGEPDYRSVFPVIGDEFAAGQPAAAKCVLVGVGLQDVRIVFQLLLQAGRLRRRKSEFQ